MDAKKEVMLFDPICEKGVKILEEANIKVKHYNSANWEKDKGNIEAIIVRTSKVPGTVIESAPNLKIVARSGVGTDNIDIAAATKKKVLVVNTPAANNISVAEHVFSLFLGLSKGMLEMDRIVRNGEFKKRDGFRGVELKGKTLGIIGFGRIGRLVANTAENGFGMNVKVYDPVLVDDNLKYERFTVLEDLLREADFVTIHVPLLPSTKNMIGLKQLQVMKPSAFLVNASRGGVVDEEALYIALRDGIIRGAGLDVFSSEPPDSSAPLFSLPNVIFTPHSAAFTEEAMECAGVQAAEEVVAVLSGKAPRFLVNPDALKNN